MGQLIWRRLTPEVGWFSFALSGALCLLAAFSTYRADWADGLAIVIRAVVLGVLVAYLLGSVFALPDWLAHPVSVAIGSGVSLWLMQGLVSDQIGDWRVKLAFLWARWERWYLAVRTGERADDLYLFLLLMTVTHFAVGYLATWLLVRHSHAWISVLLPTIVILINAGYARKVSVLLVALAVGLDLLVVGRVALVQRFRLWRQRGVPYASAIAWQSLWVLSWLALVVLLVGWMVPLGTHSSRVAAALQPTSRPWMEVRDTLARWFPSVRGPGSGRARVGGFASFGDRFDIGGPLRLSDEAVLFLAGNHGEYLTVRTYDTYTGKGWRSSAVPDEEVLATPTAAAGESATPVEPVPLVEYGANETMPVDTLGQNGRETATYRVEVLQPRGAALAYTGTPVSFSIPVRALYGWTDATEWRTLDLGTTSIEAVPIELRPLAQLLRDTEFRPSLPASAAEPSATPSPYEGEAWFWWFMRGSPVLGDLDRSIRELAARGIEVRFWWETDGENAYRITRIAYRGRLPDYSDLEAVYPADGSERGLTYEFVTSVSRATSEELRAGVAESANYPISDGVVTKYGVSYPRELYERYTQLPDTVTERTRQLAYALADGKSNVYDIATAIEQFVRQRIAYNEAAPVPGGIDAVDTILFVRPEGYCTFYASSMAVLLRVLGIPARVAVGYYPAEYDSELGGFVYRDRNAHAWVEVYFPGYGWIPFEPTASRPPLPRETSAMPSEILPLDPTMGANLPTDERLGLLFPELRGGEGAGAVGTAAGTGAAERHVVRSTLLGLAAVLALVVVAASLWWFWGTWGLTPVARLFVRMQRLARLAGIRTSDAVTPLEFAWELGQRVPGTRRGALTIAELYTREQYARRQASPEELHLAARGWRELVRPRLIRAIFRWRRSVDRDDATGAATRDRSHRN
ncbi:MAG: transglutaminase domain-containing protein [Thermomicrobium sp.]|nr:transglutaminase domain-containing protein [Thermomicrobium sp.]MDW8059258.1 transglutaminase domain-containing protein [Thermomicrobium sp.]